MNTPTTTTTTTTVTTTTTTTTTTPTITTTPTVSPPPSSPSFHVPPSLFQLLAQVDPQFKSSPDQLLASDNVLQVWNVSYIDMETFPQAKMHFLTSAPSLNTREQVQIENLEADNNDDLKNLGLNVVDLFFNAFHVLKNDILYHVQDFEKMFPVERRKDKLVITSSNIGLEKITNPNIDHTLIILHDHPTTKDVPSRIIKIIVVRYNGRLPVGMDANQSGGILPLPETISVTPFVTTLKLPKHYRRGKANPKIAMEWYYSKNNILDPTNYTLYAKDKVKVDHTKPITFELRWQKQGGGGKGLGLENLLIAKHIHVNGLGHYYGIAINGDNGEPQRIVRHYQVVLVPGSFAPNVQGVKVFPQVVSDITELPSSFHATLDQLGISNDRITQIIKIHPKYPIPIVYYNTEQDILLFNHIGYRNAKENQQEVYQNILSQLQRNNFGEMVINEIQQELGSYGTLKDDSVTSGTYYFVTKPLSTDPNQDPIVIMITVSPSVGQPVVYLSPPPHPPHKTIKKLTKQEIRNQTLVFPELKVMSQRKATKLYNDLLSKRGPLSPYLTLLQYCLTPPPPPPPPQNKKEKSTRRMIELAHKLLLDIEEYSEMLTLPHIAPHEYDTLRRGFANQLVQIVQTIISTTGNVEPLGNQGSLGWFIFQQANDMKQAGQVDCAIVVTFTGDIVFERRLGSGELVGSINPIFKPKEAKGTRVVVTRWDKARELINDRGVLDYAKLKILANFSFNALIQWPDFATRFSKKSIDLAQRLPYLVALVDNFYSKDKREEPVISMLSPSFVGGVMARDPILKSLIQRVRVQKKNQDNGEGVEVWTPNQMYEILFGYAQLTLRDSVTPATSNAIRIGIELAIKYAQSLNVE